MAVANSNSHETHCIMGGGTIHSILCKNGKIYSVSCKTKVCVLLNLAFFHHLTYQISIIGCTKWDENAKYILLKYCNENCLLHISYARIYNNFLRQRLDPQMKLLGRGMLIIED